MADETDKTAVGSKTTPAKQIGILGTGQYATAFAQRLLANGYSITLGSRHPATQHTGLLGRDSQAEESALGDVRVTTREDCVISNDVIIVALHADHFQSTFVPELVRLCAGKILVDVSNRSTRSDKHDVKSSSSNTELLASLVPEATVVKAFNSISAYVMENDVTAGGTRAVAVASDDVRARRSVCTLAEDMGFEPHENGNLRNAWRMEEAVLTVFPEWRVAGTITLLLMIFWVLLGIARFYLTDNKLKWSQLPLKVFNKVFAATALVLLSLTYSASTCAAFLQMAYGTKRRRFPRWLNHWLKARRQLGLMAFWLISVHAVISALILSPAYMSSWFESETNIHIPANHTQDVHVRLGKAWMTWIGELSLLFGVLAFALMSLQAVTSLPSVTNSLNWSEWRLVHSRLGYVMLALAVTHIYIMGVPKWVATGFPLTFFRIKFQSVIMPTLVILTRLFMMLPCVSAYVTRIRSGWERGSASTGEEH